MAGKVAPMATVAGSKSRKVPLKAQAHCHIGAGCVPMRASSQSLAGDISHSSASPHKAIAPSQNAYQRTGRSLRSMRGPSHRAPSAMPPKNAATTASTEADSCPSHKAHCCVHTTW